VNSSTKPHRASILVGLLACGFGLLYVFSRFIPGHLAGDYPAYKSVDDSWTQVLHMAYVQHLQFGRDIVFTYGPWGFLAGGYDPATYDVSVAAWLVLSLAFIGAGWWVARYFFQNVVLAWVWLILFTAAASLPVGNDIGSRMVAWGILLIFLHFFVEEVAFSRWQAVLAFTFGWLGLIKFTGFMEGGLLVAVIALDNIVRHKRFPWIIPVWLAGIIFFWLLARQQPGLLWPFLRNSWALTNGYSDAMNEGGLLALEPLIFIVIGTGFWLLGATLLQPPRLGIGTFYVLAMGGFLFLSFKHGYLGDDHVHKIDAAMTLLLLGLACLGRAMATQKKSVIYWAVFLLYASIALASNAFARHTLNLSQQIVATLSFDNLSAPVKGLLTNHLEETYEKRLNHLRAATPLPPVTGPADLYSCFQSSLFANGIAYRPRPVVQSYSAYTPALAKMNADWLRTGQSAPDIFFAIEPLAERFPSLDDGLSWPELLTRYDIKGLSDAAGTYLHLLRSATSRKYWLVPLGETNVTLGKSFALPLTNGPVWAEIEIKKTLAGDILSFLYKPAVLMVDARLADDTSRRRRLIPGISQSGFLLSPYIANNLSFIELAQGDETALSGKAVVSLTIFEGEEPGPALCYQPQIAIRYYRLDFPPQDIRFQVLETIPTNRRTN
jgi:hypothetical protein